MSRVRMAMKLADKGCLAMAHEIAENLSDTQFEQGLSYDRIGAGWRKAYSVARLLGEVRAELVERLGIKDQFECDRKRYGINELVELLDTVREEVGALCSNFHQPGMSSGTQAKPEGSYIEPQPSDANVVQVSPERKSWMSLARADRLGRAACKLLVGGHSDLAGKLLAV